MKHLLALLLILATLAAAPLAWAQGSCYTLNKATGAWVYNPACSNVAAPYGSLVIPAGKIAVIGNTLTFLGTDGSTFNIGAGGTLGSAAYTSISAYQAANANLSLYAAINPSVNVQSFLSAANYPAMLTLLGAQPLGSYVSESTTVNGHALSSNVTVSASDLTTGTLPHAQLPALQSGDIPNNAANTSGNAGTATSAAGLSGAYIDWNAASGGAEILNKPAGLTTAPTIQKFTSGSGTYTTPANVKWIRVRMVGGGAGGSGSGTTGQTAGGAGGNTTFGSSLLSAGGGSGSATNPWYGGLGGTASLGSGPIGIALSGAGGNAGIVVSVASTLEPSGGSGGHSAFGGGGNTGYGVQAAQGGVANTGGGGAGASASETAAMYSGAGGGSGGFVDAIIASPNSSYSYAVGASGTAGSAGTSGYAGGAGGSGLILVEEHYNY